MPFNVTESISINSKSVLRFPAPFGTPRKSVVIDANDATAFPAPTNRFTRFLVPQGTLLVDSTVAGKVTKFNGTNGPIIGVLVEPVDLALNSTESEEPAAAFFSGVIFATEQIVDFTLYASEIKADLPRCDFA